jgi:hypothetical protein
VQSIAKITGLVTSMEVKPKRLKEAKGCHSNIPAPGAGNGHSLSPNLQVTSLKEIKLATTNTFVWLHFIYLPFLLLVT